MASAMVFNGFIHITPRSIWRWLFLPYKSIMAYILVLRNLNQRDIVQNDKCRSSMLLNCHQMYFSFTQASHSQHFCHGCRHLTWQNSEFQPQNCLKYFCAYFQPHEIIYSLRWWMKKKSDIPFFAGFSARHALWFSVILHPPKTVLDLVNKH